MTTAPHLPTKWLPRLRPLLLPHIFSSLLEARRGPRSLTRLAPKTRECPTTGIVNYQVDLGIGKLQYLIWWDEFNLAHLFVLVIALLETIYAHRLVINENEGKAREMDHFAYWFIQAGVYPVLLVALVMWDALENGQPTPKQSGDIVLGVGLVVVMLASVAVVLARARLHERKKAQLLARLGASQGAVDLAALRGLFRMYEVANLDGDVNIGNVRELMRACYPNVERKLFKTAMETMREHFDEDAVSSHDDRFDLFVQALLAVVDVLGEWPATKLATTDHPRISKGLAGWMKPEGRV